MKLKSFSIGFHDVTEDGIALDGVLRTSPGTYSLTRKGFRNHLGAIHAKGVNVQTICGARVWQTEVPIFLTFDDGAVGGYTCVAEELERLNWRGHFLIATDWIDKPGFMNKHQIRELNARGHVVGSHTRSHPERMSSLGWPDLLSEWCTSCAVLEDIVGQRTTVASVANGYHSTRVARAAAEAGIEVLFNSEPRASIEIVDGCLVIGRYSIKAGTEPRLSGRIATGDPWARGKQQLMWNAAKLAKSIGGESYLTVRKFLLSRS